MKYWFLLQYKANCFRLAENNLINQNVETFLPLQEITTRRGNKFRNELKPLFPGYIFFAVKEMSALWHRIENTKGVSKIVKVGGKAKLIPPELVDKLREQCDSSTTIFCPEKISKGSKVTIGKGPFSCLIAKVDKIEPQSRVWLLLEHMGHYKKVSTNLDSF